MEEVKKLYWISEIDVSGRNWVVVNPPTGFGDVNNVKITVSEDTTYSTATSSTITFKCYSPDNKLIKSTGVTVCRCICDCNRAIASKSCYYGTSENDMIPQTGLTAGTQILSYSISNRCSDKVTASIEKSGESPQELRCNDGKAYLTSDILSNIKFYDVEWTAKIYYNGKDNECASFQILQKKKVCTCEALVPPLPPCNCYDVTFSDPLTGELLPGHTTEATQTSTSQEKAIIWANILTNEIPVTGLTAGTIVGTYSLSPDDLPCADSLKGYLSGASRVISLSFANGNITISEALPTNTNQTKNDWKTGVWFDGMEEPCEGTDEIFKQKCCSCSDFNVEFTISEIPVSGWTTSRKIGTFTPSECSNSFLKGKAVGSDYEYDLSFRNTGSIYLTKAISKNIGTDNKKYSFYAYFNDVSNVCEKKENVEQASCGCGNFEFVAKTYDETHKIPVSGLTAGTTIATYNLTNGCGDISELEPVGIIGNTPLTFENGEIKLSETIGINADNTELPHEVKIKFNSDDYCDALTYSINQKACNCTNNIYWVHNETTFKNNGETAGKYIATFAMQDSIGCGYDLMTGTIKENGTGDDLGLVVVPQQGTYNINVVGEVPPNAGAAKTFVVHLEYNGTECHSFNITQAEGRPCVCGDVKIIDPDTGEEIDGEINV